MKCLAASPGTVGKALAPGTVNRLDDFTYIHINQTNTIHNSVSLFLAIGTAVSQNNPFQQLRPQGSFLPWHRLFIWRMEQALRDECGYEGALPYWDIARFSPDQTASKVWDGSMTSFGGDGEYLADAHGPFAVIIPGLAINLTTQWPAGTGGGCVRDGPFADFTVSLGPVDKPYVNATNKYGYEANPRCLRRNFDPASSAALSWDAAAEVLRSPDIATFRRTMDDIWHRPSHAFIGRDGIDLFTSPNDPAFYLLHAQVDRLWAIWQGQDLEAREYAVYGNRTFEGIPLDTAPTAPPSNVTLDDVMDLGGGYRPLVKEGLSMAERGRCYIYA